MMLAASLFSTLAGFALARVLGARPGSVDTYSLGIAGPGEVVCDLRLDDRRRVQLLFDARLAHTFSDQILHAAAKSLPKGS